MALSFHKIPGSEKYIVHKDGATTIWSKSLALEALSAKECKIDARDSIGGTMLLFAAATGDAELMEELILSGASLRVLDNKGCDVNMHILRALSIEKDFAKYKMLEILSDFFIEKSLTITVDTEGKSLLSYAVEAKSLYWVDIVSKRMLWQFEEEDLICHMQQALDIAVKGRYVPAISALLNYKNLAVRPLVDDKDSDYLSVAFKFYNCGNRKQAKKLLIELEEKYFSKPFAIEEPDIVKVPAGDELVECYGPPISTDTVAVPLDLFDF